MEVKRFKSKYVSEVSSFLEKRFLDLNKEFDLSQADAQEIFDHCKEDYILKQSKKKNILMLVIKEDEEIVGFVVGGHTPNNGFPSVSVALYSEPSIKKEVIKAFEKWCKTKNFKLIRFIDYKKEPYSGLGYEKEKVMDDGYGNEEILIKKEI